MSLESEGSHGKGAELTAPKPEEIISDLGASPDSDKPAGVPASDRQAEMLEEMRGMSNEEILANNKRIEADLAKIKKIRGDLQR